MLPPSSPPQLYPYLALLRQSIATADPAARQRIFDALERRFRAEVPAIILYNTHRVTALRDRVTGYRNRSEENTSELQSLMRISFAVLCLKPNTGTKQNTRTLI